MDICVDSTSNTEHAAEEEEEEDDDGRTARWNNGASNRRFGGMLPPVILLPVRSPKMSTVDRYWTGSSRHFSVTVKFPHVGLCFLPEKGIKLNFSELLLHGSW